MTLLPGGSFLTYIAMEVDVEDVTLANFSRIYDIIMTNTGFKSLLLRDFGLNLHSFLNVMYYFCAIVGTAIFDLWHIITFHENKNFAETLFQVAMMAHVSSLFARFGTVFVYRKEIDMLITLDYRDFNSNRHRPNSSLKALKESYVLLKKLDYFTKKSYLVFTIIWYIGAGIISKQFLGFLTGSNGFEEVIRILNTTLPGEPPIAIQMCRWAFHVVFCLVFIYLLASTDIFCFGITVLLDKQYQILRNSLYYQSEDPTESADPLELKWFVQDHVKLIRITKILQKVMSPIVTGQVSHTIIIVACCVCLVATPTANQGKQSSGNLLLYATVCLSELYAFCWLSHISNAANQQLGVGIYASSWYESPDPKKRDWILPLMMTQKTIRFKALGLMEINMDTFLSVLQVSYSYFTLIQSQL